jgi:prevent-host-death family protein
MTKSVMISEAKRRFSALVEEASGGAEIVITKRGKPIAKLVPLSWGEAR